MNALLLFVGLALASDVPQLSKRTPNTVTAAVRFRYTDTNDTGSGYAGTSGSCVQDQCFTLTEGGAWTQRTEVSAQIADKRWVGLAVTADADFARIRSLAASVLGEKWLLAIHYGAFPQVYEKTTHFQTDAGYYLDPDVLPEDSSEPRVYRRIDARTFLVEGNGIDLFLGAIWVQTTEPLAVLASTQENVNDDERLAVFDTHSRSFMAGVTGGIDSVPYVLRRKCRKAVCFGFAGGQSIKIGPARVSASDEASKRYRRIFGVSPDPVWGLGWGSEAHVGLMAFRKQARGTVGVDIGYTGDIQVLRWVASDTTHFGGIGGSSGPRSRFTLYYGPYIQGTGRF